MSGRGRGCGGLGAGKRTVDLYVNDPIMHDTVTYSGTEVVNAIREVIRNNGGPVGLDLMVVQMPEAGHYPELEDDPRELLNFLIREYEEFMSDRQILVSNNIFYEI